MPTHDPRLALCLDAAHDVVARDVAPSVTSGNGLGLEVEFFPIVPVEPSRRLPLHGGGLSVEQVLQEHGAGSAVELHGCSLTVEPGGQVEIATACCDTPDAVLGQARAAAEVLAGSFERAGVALVSAGLDLWHGVADVPQQLREPRYPAMASYFASRGPAGATMMRHTCALQLTLDLGVAASDAHERWTVANLLAPVATATFASSPTRDGTVRSARSMVWQHVDPTRTGFPTDLLADRGTLPDHVTRAALEADVLLVRTGVDTAGRVTAAAPGRPGWTFADWVRDGHDQYGWPDADDLRYHLTTLFHEVRARGPVEIRSVDALPHRWRSVPVVLYSGALFDAVARSRILEVLAPHRAALPTLLHRAATTGLANPSLCALAVEVWSFALAGARRLPGVAADHLAVTEAFIDRFTVRGRCPADELAAAFRRSPTAALELLREPSPSPARSRR